MFSVCPVVAFVVYLTSSLKIESSVLIVVQSGLSWSCPSTFSTDFQFYHQLGVSTSSTDLV